MKRVICLGSYQGGDVLGWLIAEAIQKDPAQRDAIEVLCCASPAQLPALCASASLLMVIDATPDLAPGCVHRLNESELAERYSCSSHGVDLLTSLGIARALGDLPAGVIVLGVGVDDSAPETLLQMCLPAVRAVLEGI